MSRVIVQVHPHLHERPVAGALAGLVSLGMLLMLPWQAALVAVTVVWLGAWRLLERLPPVAGLIRGAHAVRDALARRVLVDPQDAPYLSTVFGLGLLVPARLALSLGYQVAVVGVLQGQPVSWPAVFLFHVLWMGPNHPFFGHATTLMHHHGHQGRIFQPRYKLLDIFLVYVLGTLYGHVPESFAVGHVRNHHRYDNGPEDVLTTMHLDRSRFVSWLRYRTQFLLYWSGASVVDFFFRRGQGNHARRQLRGMVFYYGLGLLLLVLHPGPTVAYYLLPQIMVMNFLSAINFMWHGFIDPADPVDPYSNSLTILDATQDIWNEAYHVSHHDRPQARWVDMPAHYAELRDAYVRRRSLVFRKTQVMELFALVMLGKLGDLADRAFVEGQELSKEELVAELRRRLMPVPKQVLTAAPTAAK